MSKKFDFHLSYEEKVERKKALDSVVQPGLESSVLIKVALKRLDLEYGTRWTRRSYYLGETTSSHGISGDIEANGKRYALEGFKEDAKKFDLQEANKIVQELSKQINEEDYRDVSDENMNTADILLSVRIVKKIV